MNTSYKIAGILILAGVLGLSACDSSGEEAAPEPPVATSATASPVTSTPDTPALSPAPAAEGSEPSATASTNGDEMSVSPAQDSSRQLEELLRLAGQGRVPGVEYAAHSSLIDEVEAAWGEPDLKEPAGKGFYATYSDKHVVFGFNKGSRIFDVRSSASTLQGLTLKQIKEALGEPDNTTVNGQDKIYIYKAGKEYQLKFIIPETSGTVDHISVFSEQDSHNNMAG